MTKFQKAWGYRCKAAVRRNRSKMKRLLARRNRRNARLDVYAIPERLNERDVI